MNTSAFEHALTGQTQGNPPEESTADTHSAARSETIEFEEDPLLQIPPSFNQAVHKETLREEERPFILWAKLKLHIQPHPTNVANAVFDGLANFLEAAAKEDKQFIIFPYHLSDYSSLEDLPPVLNDVETLPDEVDDWLLYFSEARPCGHGGDIYTVVLIGISMPFSKFIKKLSLWCKEKIWSMAILLAVGETGIARVASIFNQHHGYRASEDSDISTHLRHTSGSQVENDPHGNPRKSESRRPNQSFACLCR